jgi:hypothetical protein
MNETTIKNIYYVDENDNTKNNVLAVNGDVDIRKPEVIDKIAEKLGDIFSFVPYISLHKEDIARCIAHHNFANIHEYTFGVEEIDFLS